MTSNNTNNEKERITPIAITNWRDIRHTFGIREKNRRGHMYVVGKTGTGKSTLLATMALSDICQGNGCAIIDPHGDLAETILSRIPPNRINDVIYVNPSDLAFPIAFNPLANVQPDLQHLVVSGLISIFKKIWPEFWGPRLEHILRFSFYTLLEYPFGTLLDVAPLLTDSGFRKNVIQNITYEPVRSFWTDEFDKYTPWLRSEATAPILNKMSQFLTNLPLRNIVGQHKNSFKFREIMDSGKILIVNLAKGKLGEDNCSLLGSMFTTMIFLASLSRVNVPEEKRRPFYFFVDEFHSFVTLSFADMLSESRKYGLNLILAHQYIRQLNDHIRDAVFGNIGTIISFRIGSDDAFVLSREFSPSFNEIDLINLANYHIYIKLMINGVTSQPFSGITQQLPPIAVSYKDEIIKHSREAYSHQRSEVEKGIQLKTDSIVKTKKVSRQQKLSLK